MMFGLGELVVDNNDLGRWKHHQLRLLHVCSKACGPIGSDMRMGWKGIFFSGRHFTSLVHLLSISFFPHQEESDRKQYHTISHQFWSEEIPIQQIHRITPRIRVPRKMFVTCVFPPTNPGTAQPLANNTCLFATPDDFQSMWLRFLFLSHLASHRAGVSPFLAHLVDKMWICLKGNHDISPRRRIVKNSFYTGPG